MKKSAFKYIVAAILAISLLMPTFAVTIAAATTGERAYAAEGGWLDTNPNAPDDYAYSIAIVGDTQSLVVKDLENGTNYMGDIYSWIADNAAEKNIQYVLGVGDITEYKENFDSSWTKAWEYSDEWDHAKAAITLLDNKVPYSLCRGGGHDTSAKLNEYFASHSYYADNLDGTYKSGDVCNTYSCFEVGSIKYLILALDWNPSDAVIAWADGVIAANPDRRVILTTHAYLAKDGTLLGSSASHSSVPADNNGVDLYEKLVSKHDNVQLVISGHDPSSNLVYRQDARESGSVVTSLLVDPQTFDSQNNGETGMICMLYFSEDGNTMDVEWYSTVRDQYYKESNQYTLKLNEMSSEDGSIVTKYGTIPAAYTNADEYPFLTFVDGEFRDLGAYDPFHSASGTLERALRKLSADQEVVIIARKNHTVIDGTTGYFPSNYMAADITIDLMGHTVDAMTSTPTNLFASATTQTFDTNLTVKNGTIKLGKGLISVSTGGGEKTQSFTFENLDIVSNCKELIIFNQYKTAGNVNIDFNDCDVNFLSTSGFAGNVFRAGNSGDTTPLISAAVTVKGGSVTVPSFDTSRFVQEYNGSTVSFVANEKGELTKVMVPTSATVNEKAFRDTEGNLNLYLVKNAANDTVNEYVLESLETPYGTVPYAYSDKTVYPFAAFTDNGYLALTAGLENLFHGNVANTIERKTRSMSGITYVNVILRTNYTVVKDSSISGSGQLLTNYQKVPFTLDLMGHTLTSLNNTHLFCSNGMSTDCMNTIFTVKNGKIVTDKAIVTVANKPGKEGKVQNFTFENLDISISDSGLLMYNTSGSNTNIAGSYNINFIDCNITSENLATSIFNASDAGGYISNTITVKGGSITLNKFNASKFVMESTDKPCAVNFLPGDNGEYMVLRVLNSTTASFDVNCTTNNGERDYVLFGTDNGYGVYLLRDEAKLVIPQMSLTMYSSFTYNVYVPMKSFITKITLGGNEYDITTLATKEIEGEWYYHIEKEIPVGESAEQFTLIVESDAQTQRWTLDVVSYAKKIIDGSYTNVEKQLARDILAYIRAIYVYNNDEKTEAALSRINAIIGKDYAVEPVIGEIKQSTNGLSGAGLYLAYKPAFYFYPKYDPSAYTFTVNGAEVTTEVASINGKMAILVYTYAYAITETITYTIDGTDISGEYNLAAYLAFVEDQDQTVADVVKALWQYSDSAKAYRAQFN